VGGDAIDLNLIRENLERAEELMDIALEGGMLSATQRLEAVSAPEVRHRAEAIAPQVRHFRELSEEREAGFKRGEDVGIGSEMDEEFDQFFGVLLDDLRELDGIVGDRLDAAHARSSFLFRTILVAWILIVAIAVGALTRLEILQRRAEQALRESDEQLRQAQKMEAVGRLAGGMAHDINSYLAAISAQCELVMMTSEDDSALHQRMDAVVSTTTKASALIERLLSFSRRKPVQPQVVNLNQTVLDLSKLLERLIGEDVQLETDLQGELWNVEVDPSQIEQVILNLVVNSREAMPTGGELRIQTLNQALDARHLSAVPVKRMGDYVVLRVSDTGAGIPEEMQERIFEPFVSTKIKTNQSGLGLAMVYSIAQQNGGGVNVISSEGGGAMFSVYLPRTRALARVTNEPEGQVLPRGEAQHILLVEDNNELREAVAGSLESLGYRVSVASSGEEALEQVERLDSSFELLITDVVMPGINGRELFEQLCERDAALEVLFISGYTDDVVLRHGIEQGEFRFLQKPFSIRDLALLVADILAS
jgi:signal transduction histidine kinase